MEESMASISNPNFDELRWVIRIRRTLDEELEDDEGIPVSIFKVPKSLMTSNPDSYTPQSVALGPYHCWRPEVHEMERYKLSAAKSAKKFNQRSLKFHDLVEQFMKFEQKIRASYQSYLDFNGETLAWMMAIDASFLIEFLNVFAFKQGKMKILTRVSSRLSNLVYNNAVLRDIIMLENQIPFFILKKMMEFQSESSEQADEILISMSMGLFKEISLFNSIEEIPKIESSNFSHLLDFLYQMIIPRSKDESSQTIEISDDPIEVSTEVSNPSLKIKNLALKLIKGTVFIMKKSIQSKPMKIIMTFPLMILSNIPGFSILKQPMEYLFFTQNEEETKGRETESNRPPLMEEIAIPSVSQLVKAGVSFSPSNGGIASIKFDSKTAKFYLPTTILDVNTEVILRNLVAYEASNSHGSLIFTRYTELMNGIIDSDSDVKLLREKRVIMNHLKSDEEAAMVWNGMSKSIRMKKVLILDKVIEEVNEYYNGLWRVKIERIVKEYLYNSWPLLTLMAAIWILFFIALQTFCSLFGCFHVFSLQRF